LPAVGNPDRLIIAPDGVLFEVPFHALYDGEQYLLEQYEVTYAPSAGALRLCRENECRRNGTSKQAFVIGCTLGDKLPYVQQEIEAVARAIPGATVVSGEAASLPSLQGYAAESGVLHLATHAVFRRDNPLFSALQLAGEGWLRLMDLYSLRLNGALVTLSGCETGRHRLLGGDLLGLSRGFFYAGASALVVSLWPVDDMSTAILMERFYTHLVAGMAAASALRQAQVELYRLEVERDGQWLRPYAHPFYWAPFCLLGAPGV
jgi:CHAT domain-containing protein